MMKGRREAAGRTKRTIWGMAIAWMLVLAAGQAQEDVKRVSSAEALQAALSQAEAGSAIELAEDLVVEEGVEVREGVRLMSGGHTLTVRGEMALQGKLELGLRGEVNVEGNGMIKIRERGGVEIGGEAYIGEGGIWVIGEGGELRLRSGGIEIWAGSVKAAGEVREGGTIQIEQGGRLEIEGNMEAEGTLTNMGDVQVKGQCQVEKLTNCGEMAIEEGGEVYNRKWALNQGEILVEGYLNNQGLLQNGGSIQAIGKGKIEGAEGINGQEAGYDVMLEGILYGLEGALEAAESGAEAVLERDAEVRGQARIGKGVKVRSQGHRVEVSGILEVGGILEIGGHLGVGGEVRVEEGGILHVRSEGEAQVKEGGEIKIEGEGKWEGNVEGRVSYGITLEGEIQGREREEEGKLFLSAGERETLYASGANFEKWGWSPKEALQIVDGSITDRQISITCGEHPQAAVLAAWEKDVEASAATPTPSPTPTASPAPTETPTPTPSPTPTASPAPTETPAPTPSSTPTASPAPTPSPTLTPHPTSMPTTVPERSGEVTAYAGFPLLTTAKGKLVALPQIPGGAEAWRVEDETIAKLVNQGTGKLKIQGLRLGSTQLYFNAAEGSDTLKPGAAYAIQLHVRKGTQVAQGVKVKPKHLTMVPGETREVRAELKGKRVVDKQVIYESSDVQVVRVDGEGRVKAVGLGNAQITAYSANMKAGRAEITVAPVAIRTMEGEPPGETMELQRGERVRLQVKSLWEAEQVEITWSSSAPKVANVDQTGRVQGLKAGKAVLTATVQVQGASYQAKLPVRVTKAAHARIGAIHQFESP